MLKHNSVSAARWRAKKLAEDPVAYRKNHNAVRTAWRNRNIERERARCRAMAVEKRMLYEARSRAKRKGWPFDIELSDVVVPSVCPALGLPIVRGSGRPGPQSPTLDRMDSRKGYVKGNVNVISFRANSLKNNATVEELERILQWMKGRSP